MPWKWLTVFYPFIVPPFHAYFYFVFDIIDRIQNYTPEDSNHLLGLVIDIWQYREWLGLFSKFSIEDEPKEIEVAKDTDAVAQ